MAKIYRVTLTTEEQILLETILKNNSQTTARAKRCYVLLASDENGDKKWSDRKIEKCYGISIPSIERLRKRFVESGLEAALYGIKQEIKKEKIFDGRVESQLVALRCGEVPSGILTGPYDY
ncbi:MAG: helix-turn-helix domain-containing protein [Bacteroidota bacterium]